MRTVGLIAFAIFFPVMTHAAVLINEVAWMGTAANANAEWMELLNTSDAPVDLSGWHLAAGNGSPNIPLTGTIDAHGYFLLERTSDASVPTVTADQIYAGALANSGTTLTLTDASGAPIDQVTGGANWVNIGGDNASKETAQRTDSGWETAAPTPRAANTGSASSSSADSTPPASDANASNTESAASTTANTSTSSGGGPAEYLPVPVLRIITSSNHTVVSGADTAFSSAVYDSKGNKRNDAIVTWSFGDGMQRTGSNVFHAYGAPGEYVVVVHARTSDDGDALTESIVTVQDASVRIASLSDHGIALINSSSRTLDLSYWRLSMGGQEFKIPDDTHILAGRTVLFPVSIIELPLADSATLLYPNGEVAATYPVATAPRVEDAALQPSLHPTSYNQVQKVDTITSPRTNIQTHEQAVIAPTATVEPAAVGAAPAAKTATAGLFHSPWTLSLLGVIAAAGGAFILL